MADLRTIDTGDWLAAIITIVLACAGGVATAMAWFRASKDRLYARLEKVEKLVQDSTDARAAHTTQIALLESNQDMLEDRLKEIKDEIRRSAESGARLVASQLQEVLAEVKKGRH